MSHMLLVAFLAGLLCTSCIPSDDAFLDREQFDLPVNGTDVRTTKPLAPYARYVIRLSSPFDLEVFRTEISRWFRPNDVYWHFVFDGAETFHNRDEKGPNFLINHMVFEAQGTGRPLQIRTSENFTARFDASTLSALITRSRWWRQEDGTSIKLDLLCLAISLLILVLAVVCGLLSLLFTRPAPARPVPVTHKTLTPPQTPSVHVSPLALPAPHHHQHFTLQPRKPCASPDPFPEGTRLVVTLEGLWVVSATSVKGVTNPDLTLYGVDAEYAGPCTKPVGAWQPHHKLFFDDADEPAVSFHHDRHHHRFSFAYVGTGDRLVLFLEVPAACAGHHFWHHDTLSVTVREMSSAERAELDALPVDADRHAEEKKRQAYLERIRVLKIEYDGRRYLGDEQWIEEYVTKHLDDLLRDRTRITKAHRALHAEADFVRLFQETDPELYTHVTWEYRALCRAEELEPGNTTKRPKLTPEERQAKFERYRERALERDRIQAEDRMAAIRQKLSLLQQFGDDLDTYDLDEDERARLVKEFEDDLFAPTEEDLNGTYKKV